MKDDNKTFNAQNIYDNSNFFEEYITMRETHVNANDLLEIPVMKDMLPDLANKSVLDLGCGYGELSKLFAEQGAKRVLACDISKNMIDLANKYNHHENIEFKVLSMEELNLVNEKFDVVFSSLAFHYIEDYDKLISDISERLNPNGILLFSQEHPVTTAPILDKETKNRVDINGKRYYLLSDYNNVSARNKMWNNEDVVKYHRNFKTVLNTLMKYNLQLLEIDESNEGAEATAKVEKYKYQKDRPYFLFVKAVKK